ncbi:metalloprotease PmbA [Arenicella xantha]|uniref:PmbA protein n=1 Tax=Arenicella xantha TaxID=644221 RepID=A0A395JRP2_9GAMM|nr:metalloprotease PmbA [Arenicella xantha]RBP53245.1 PmbA protein [Arenicella xantha]
MSKLNTGVGVNLTDAAQFALEYAKQSGADQSEVSLHLGTGVSVTARQRELETVEKHNDAQLVVSVYREHKTGSASSADLSESGIKASVDAAMSIARYTGADDCLGLADADGMATKPLDLDLYHPWTDDVSQLADIALQCESAALDADSRISNTEGASVNSYSGCAVYANSHGFLSETSSSQHSISCSVIGGKDDSMQRDYWYDSNRNPLKLQTAEEIGLTAARRTVERLGAKQIGSCQAPVMFDPSSAKSLIGHLIGALKGGAIYKKASFMLDKVGQQVLPDFVSITENPHILGAAGSAYHDGEGTATQAQRSLVSGGVLQGYVLASYTARKLGLQSTANSGGVRNLRVSNTGQDFAELLSQMTTGLLVTELIGSGINMVTGDYSRGAAGYWVENGVIQYPVEEITIAGNLLDMYQHMVALGNDYDTRGNTECGSIVIENMTIAGS